MVLLRVYPFHSEWTGSFGDLYLPGSVLLQGLNVYFQP